MKGDKNLGVIVICPFIMCRLRTYTHTFTYEKKKIKKCFVSFFFSSFVLPLHWLLRNVCSLVWMRDIFTIYLLTMLTNYFLFSYGLFFFLSTHRYFSPRRQKNKRIIEENWSSSRSDVVIIVYKQKSAWKWKKERERKKKSSKCNVSLRLCFAVDVDEHWSSTASRSIFIFIVFIFTFWTCDNNGALHIECYVSAYRPLQIAIVKMKRENCETGIKWK